MLEGGSLGVGVCVGIFGSEISSLVEVTFAPSPATEGVLASFGKVDENLGGGIGFPSEPGFFCEST